MRLGLYGGSFNPIHVGHLLIGEFVREEWNLDEIWFIPSATPPHKRGQELATAELRVQMVRLAIRGNPRFRCSEIEIRRGGISYTRDTLRQIRDELGQSAELFWFIGMDNLVDFHKWRHPEEILSLCKLIVLQRPGFSAAGVDPDLLNQVIFSRAPLLDISSSLIRRRVQTGLSIRYFVPDSVRHFIYEKQLYGSQGETHSS